MSEKYTERKYYLKQIPLDCILTIATENIEATDKFEKTLLKGKRVKD